MTQSLPALPATQLRYSEQEAQSAGFVAVEERHVHVGTRLVTANASLTRIIRLEQTFPQVLEGQPGWGAPGALPRLGGSWGSASREEKLSWAVESARVAGMDCQLVPISVPSSLLPSLAHYLSSPF